MSLLLVIDGVTAAPTAAEAPHLARWVAVGDNGRLREPVTAGPDWALFGAGAAPVAADGYWAALGLGLAPDPGRTWGRAAFVHLRRHRDRLLLAPPEVAQATAAEAAELAQGLRESLAESGWQLHGHASGHWVVEGEPLSQPVAGIPSPNEGAGRSVTDCWPWGPEALPVRRLLLETQLLLARHPVNQARQRQGRPALNSLWVWGVGSGTEVAGDGGRGRCCSYDPKVVGMARAAGWAASLQEAGCLQGGQPSVWHVDGRQGWQELDARVIQPLQQQDEVWVIGGRAWLRVAGRGLTQAKRFWHRGRWGEGRELSWQALRASCLC